MAAQSTDISFRSYYTSLQERTVSELQAFANTDDELQAAFASLELHRRTRNQAHASRAARLLVQVIKKDENHAWARFGLATALVRMPRAISIVRSIRNADTDPASEAELQLRKALKIDPAFAEANELLATLVGPQRSELVEVEFTDAASYFETLATADEVTLQRLVRDVAIITSSQELMTLTQGTADKRRAVLQMFWKKRSVRDGVSQEARVTEHYRRIQYALENFGRFIPATTVWGKKREGWERDLEDRGLIYVRFGAPYERNGVLIAETLGGDPWQGNLDIWAYINPDGRYRTYYFIKGRLESDPLRGTLGVADTRTLLGLLSKYDQRYAFIAARLQTSQLYDFMRKAGTNSDPRQEALAQDVGEQRRRITEKNHAVLFAAMDMDAAAPLFMRPLTLFTDFATFRGRAGCTDVVYSVSAPAPAYRLNVAIADTFAWDFKAIDTLVTAPAERGEHVRATGVMCATPDYNSYVRVTASSDSTTGVTAGGELRIPDYSGRTLMISDMLFASTEPGPFIRGNAHLALVPPRQFREGEGFRVFYELYNLPAGRPYRTEITFTTKESNIFARLFKGKTTTTVTFEGISEGGDVVQELRTLVPQIEADEAEVQITVRDLTSGEAVQTRKKIWIIPRP